MADLYGRPQLWLGPFPVLFYQIYETFDRFGFRNVELNRLLTDVEIYFPGRAADIAEIRVRHFAGSIHNAAHDGDLYTFQVLSAIFDSRRHRLQIEKSAATTWTGDVVRLE